MSIIGVSLKMSAGRAKFAGVVALVAAVMLSASFQLFFIKDGAGGRIFWKEDEADLFLSASQAGFHFTYLAYPFFRISEYLGMRVTPSAQTANTLIIRITNSGIERRIVRLTSGGLNIPLFLTPFEDGFYAICQGGILCKLSGNTFVPATVDEQRVHEGTKHLVRGGAGFADGWHERDVVAAPGDHFQIEIGKNLAISAVNHATGYGEDAWISVNLQRPGQQSENLYDARGSLKKVSKKIYQAAFSSVGLL